MSTFPHDPAAEAAVLGACLISDAAIEAAEPFLTPDDFHDASNGNIWRSILATHQHGRVDEVTVAHDLKANGHDGDRYNIASLQALTATTPTVSNAGRYARIIANHAIRKRIILAAAKVTQDAWDNTDAESVVSSARTLFDGIDMPEGNPTPDPDFVEFMETHATEYDWLIPDVLEKRDRLLITAGEGAGKSILCAQIGVMTAAGIHCWTQAPIPPRNVAIIDLENSARLLTRRLGMLRSAAIQSGAMVDRSRLRIHARPEGIDLTTSAHRRWLIDRCQANQTELLVIGPAYRMSAGVASKGDIGGEDHARTVTKALDEIRNRCNVTLVMETHAPHGGNFGRDLRPFGSSVWLRWPEFGIGIRKESESQDRYSVEHWRGPRDQRMWPTTLQRGRRWPWTAIMPNAGRVPA